MERSPAMHDVEITPDPPLPAYLCIPPDVESALPGRSFSAMQPLLYNFPTPFYTPHDSTGIPVWSDSPPHNVCAALLLSCVVPQRETVKWLLFNLRKLSSIPHSFKWMAVSSCQVLPDCLPIWVLTFWDRLSEVFDTCLSWRVCLDWAGASYKPHMANPLDSLIHQVCWHGYLKGNRRDRHVNNIFDLLSNNELNSGQINDLLELLERRLADAPDNQYLIAPSELSTLILYSHQNHTEHTHQKQYYQRSIEEGLVQRHGSAVASIAWISVGDRGHWISYIVNPITSTIFHGDSLGLQMPANLRKALQWWLHDLQKKMGELTTLPSFKPISITGQKDGFLCGILSTNSLSNHLLPLEFPLVSTNAVSIKKYRIKCTVELLKLSQEPVCSFISCCASSHIESGRGSQR